MSRQGARDIQTFSKIWPSSPTKHGKELEYGSGCSGKAFELYLEVKVY